MIPPDETLLGRAPWVSAGPLDQAQRDLVARIASTWSGTVGLAPVDPDGRLTGPFDLLLASPVVGARMLDATESFHRSSLSVRERELVILVVAAGEDAPFMWAGHRPVAVQAGLSEQVTDAIARGSSPDLLGDVALVHDLARQLVTTGDVDDVTWSETMRGLGWRRVNEITWLVGIYRAFAMAMRVARTPTPDAYQEMTDDH